ncbi:hypothetical protein [Kineococcus sp. NPDC059986]|jgi:hypothetical protein|uniref:hypothetical protein n=1 Tax=Kineococcus sp. NPDC059986 TaxID=3155538 RepID=UPI0034507A38
MRKVFGRATAAVALVLGLLVSTALPSQAATGQWSDTQNTNRPVIYQTNLQYEGAAFRVPTNVPSTAQTGLVQYNWRLLDQPPAGTTLIVWLCRGPVGTTNQCLTAYQGTPTKSGSASWDLTGSGLAANSTWHPMIALAAPTTYVLKPYPVNSSLYSIFVNYTY